MIQISIESVFILIGRISNNILDFILFKSKFNLLIIHRKIYISSYIMFSLKLIFLYILTSFILITLYLNFSLSYKKFLLTFLAFYFFINFNASV